MADQPTKPTILVKKADGTSVRMTMEEFRKYKEGLTKPIVNVQNVQEVNKVEKVLDSEVKNVPAVPVPKKIEPNEVVVIGGQQPDKKQIPHMMEVRFIDEDDNKQLTINNEQLAKKELQNSSVISPPPVKENQKMVQLPVVKEDFASAMTAPSQKELKSSAAVALPSDVAQKVEEIMRKITIPLRADLRGRLQSLLQSRLSDVRSDEQVMEYLVKSDATGGIGLKEDDARYVMNALRGAILGQGSAAKIQRQMVAEKKAPVPAPLAVPPKKSAVPTPVQSSQPPVPARPVVSASPARVAMQDVVPPPAPKSKASTGPLEELRALSLSDFRRLGKTPAEAGARLLSKFEGWKSESYVFFLDARDAWQKSPMFAAYQKVMLDALKQGKTVQDVLIGTDFKIEEFTKMAEMNSKLN